MRELIFQYLNHKIIELTGLYQHHISINYTIKATCPYICQNGHNFWHMILLISHSSWKALQAKLMGFNSVCFNVTIKESLNHYQRRYEITQGGPFSPYLYECLVSCVGDCREHSRRPSNLTSVICWRLDNIFYRATSCLRYFLSNFLTQIVTATFFINQLESKSPLEN